MRRSQTEGEGNYSDLQSFQTIGNSRQFEAQTQEEATFKAAYLHFDGVK